MLPVIVFRPIVESLVFTLVDTRPNFSQQKNRPEAGNLLLHLISQDLRQNDWNIPILRTLFYFNLMELCHAERIGSPQMFSATYAVLLLRCLILRLNVNSLKN